MKLNYVSFVFYSGARFSKVPKLYGPFSGVTVPFVSQERRGFKSSNFTVLSLFVPLKAFQKMGFPKQAVGSFINGFLGPKSFRDFRETGPCPERFSPGTAVLFSPLLKKQSKAVFTLGLDYDRIIIELNMKWVHIN